MMNELTVKKMEQLLAQEDLASEIKGMTTPEEIHAYLAEKGIEIPFEVFLEACSQAASGEEELDACDLDAVSGGCRHTAAKYQRMARYYACRGNWGEALAMYVCAAIEMARPCYHR